jgi:hypothetical protein
VLAALASAMRLALMRASLSCLGAALLLAAPAASVRDAVRRAACNSRLGAVHRLAPLAPAVRLAVRRAATNSLLGAALQLTRPLAHDTPPSSFPCAAKTPTHCDASFTAVTHPLSALNAPLVHIGHHAHDGGQYESRSDVAACLDQRGQQRLGGGRTVGV